MKGSPVRIWASASQLVRLGGPYWGQRRSEAYEAEGIRPALGALWLPEVGGFMRRICSVLGLLLLALMWTGTAGTANGDNLRQIIADRSGTDCASVNAAGNHNSVGVGIAFDGT